MVDNIMVKAGEILGDIAVASLIYDVPAMVVCSHVKGHIQAGYGGAIKNVAMGGVSSSHRECGWKCGRGAMHTIGEGKLIWHKERCELCYQCEEICPLEVIKFEKESNPPSPPLAKGGRGDFQMKFLHTGLRTVGDVGDVRGYALPGLSNFPVMTRGLCVLSQRLQRLS